jgi:hypothetical protein
MYIVNTVNSSINMLLATAVLPYVTNKYIAFMMFLVKRYHTLGNDPSPPSLLDVMSFMEGILM